MTNEQKQAQAARCPCKGTDDYCPCQNVSSRQEPRFFIDHGTIHDRATGKHVVTDGQPPFEDTVDQVCDLLNGLCGSSALSHRRTAEQENEMGVDRTDYLMFATEIDPEGFDLEKHEPEVAGMPWRRFDIIYDGMSGEYCLAGKVIAKSDPYEGFEKAKINVGALEVNELAGAVSEAFGREIKPSDFSLILFSHFS